MEWGEGEGEGLLPWCQREEEGLCLLQAWACATCVHRCAAPYGPLHPSTRKSQRTPPPPLGAPASLAGRYTSGAGGGGAAPAALSPEVEALKREWARHEAIMRAIADPSAPESLIARNAFDRISAMCAELGLRAGIVEIGHQVGGGEVVWAGWGGSWVCVGWVGWVSEWQGWMGRGRA